MLYKIKRTKTFIKKNSFTLFYKNFYKTKLNNLIIKENIKNIKLVEKKIKTKFLISFFKNSTKKTLFTNFLKFLTVNVINYKKLNTLNKNFLLNYCKFFKYYVLLIKLNNKIYCWKNVEKIYCFNYYQTKKLVYKFFATLLKKFNSKQCDLNT